MENNPLLYRRGESPYPELTHREKYIIGFVETDNHLDKVSYFLCHAQGCGLCDIGFDFFIISVVERPPNTPFPLREGELIVGGSNYLITISSPSDQNDLSWWKA